MGIWAKWERATEPKGGTIRRRGKCCFPLPTFDFSFRADSADSKPSSTMQSPPIRARSFFPFFPFIQTCQLQRHCCCRLHLASPSHRRYPVGTTSTPQLLHQPHGRYNCRHITLCGEPSTRCTRPHMRRRHTQATLPPSSSLCLVHLKKASDKSFPLFFPFVFNSAGHLPLTQARCTPRGTQASIPPPLARMQAALSPSLSPQPPPPQCLYDQRHFPDLITLQPRLCHTDRGCKRCTGPHHFHETPICSPSPFV